MFVLSTLERSYVDDVTDHKGRVNGSTDASFPAFSLSRVQTQVFSGAEQVFNQEEGKSRKRRASAPPTVNDDDFIGK